MAVSSLLGGHGHGHSHDHNHNHDAGGVVHDGVPPKPHKTTRHDVDESSGDLGFTPPCCTRDPVSQLDTFKRMASVLQHEQEAEDGQDDNLDLDINDDFADNLPLQDNNEGEDQTKAATAEDAEESPTGAAEENNTSEEKKRLVKMGMTTALAIALHNFPEGLATFVAALNDPKVGVVLAIAISIHNIPEGLCVALPIFYATGNRTKAFLWALLSGASEIVAAFLGWLILSNVFTDATYATLFGLVAGMMVIISIRELLPTAHFYDPEDTVVTHSFIAGMVVMALSLVLFVI